ncbi:hypothetical protein BJ138DRAFT_1140948 [Hygrophoropsis aurantiaca]|uniref:Uncharacterized protein n=1 Tax=Hygrophoropsis aurantiaca TaxID=72124 RepID=A0ACB8AS19_9AGAM|nr:hypothetical protein BJ138DRAFT_1140948 [Hygrophoropsis aurantiaca]
MTIDNATAVLADIQNPEVYLNYLPPAIASEYEVSRNVYIATLGALLWDILYSFPQDIRLMQISRPTPVIFVYFLSRISAVGYVFQSVIAKTGPVDDCAALMLTICIAWIATSACSSFLFLKRVQAIFLQQRMVFHAFILLWIASVGVSIVVPFGSHAGPLADTKHCINTGEAHYVVAAIIMQLVFDSLVFLAISYKLASSRHNSGEKIPWKKIFSGRALPRLSKAVLQGGQQYYLITVGANIAVTVLLSTPSVPPIYQATFTIPNIALSSSMACRVFRNLKLETYEVTEIHETGLLSTLRFGQMPIVSSDPQSTIPYVSEMPTRSRTNKHLSTLDLEKGDGSGSGSLEELRFRIPENA